MEMNGRMPTFKGRGWNGRKRRNGGQENERKRGGEGGACLPIKNCSRAPVDCAVFCAVCHPTNAYIALAKTRELVREFVNSGATALQPRYSAKCH